jgi:hypothetical protein
MTEYELYEVLHNSFDTLWESSQMYFTLVSAYLVVAYLVGDKLTGKQNVIVTTLYIVWIVGVINTQITSGTGAIRISKAISLLDTVSYERLTIEPLVFGVYTFTAVMIGGVFASLYFMWTVRHPGGK